MLHNSIPFLIISISNNIHSEMLIKQMADFMASSGYKEAGYQYVCIDVR